jgi:hypothetical protein
MAYCLLGIFNINMPLLYGEEKKAFRRLQEEIIKSTPDLSILAWRLSGAFVPSLRSEEVVGCGVLAESPHFFAGCETVSYHQLFSYYDFTITSRGIKISDSAIEVKSNDDEGDTYRYILKLNCDITVTDGPWGTLNRRRLAIVLKKCGKDQFVRTDALDWYTDTFTDENTGWAYENPKSLSRARYLLADLTGTIRGEPAPNITAGCIMLDQMQPPVFQIRKPLWGVFEQAWPPGFFDLGSQAFLPSCNSACLKLSSDLDTGISGSPRLSFLFLFFSHSYGPPTYGLVNTQRFPREVLMELEKDMLVIDDDFKTQFKLLPIVMAFQS